jgi:hypothetical protein
VGLGVPISYYLPSLMIKLVPANEGRVVARSLSASSVSPTEIDVRFSVLGENVEAAWIEGSPDGLGWERLGAFRRHPPYSFALDASALDAAYRHSGTLYLRGAARDILGDVGQSPTLTLQVQSP